MSFTVEDPGMYQKEYQIPVDDRDLSAGFYFATFRTIPRGKFKRLLDNIRSTQEAVVQLTAVLRKLAIETATTVEEIADLAERRAKFVAVREKAEQAQIDAAKELVAWGVVGHRDIASAAGVPYPVASVPVQWSGLGYTTLDSNTVGIYERLNILFDLATHTVTFNTKGALPATLEGFKAVVFTKAAAA